MIILFFLIIITYSSVESQEHSSYWRLVGRYPANYISPASGWFMSFDCRDKNNCIAFSNELRVSNSVFEGTFIESFKTTDYGNSWFRNSLEYTRLSGVGYYKTPNSPKKDYIFYLNSNKWDIRKSTNNGKTFEKIVLEDPLIIGNLGMRNITMYDENIGVAYSYAEIFLTKDGWQTITRKSIIDSPEGAILNWVFLDSTKAFVLFNLIGQNNIYHYDMNKNKFELIYDNLEKKQFYYNDSSAYSVYNPDIINDSLIFLCALRPLPTSLWQASVIFRSKDGGRNWELVLDDEKNFPYTGIQHIKFYDEKNGLAVGKNGKIITTNNGGDSWVIHNHRGHFSRPYESNGPDNFDVAWVGQTPIIATLAGYYYRYEGDFFKFPFDEIRRRCKLYTPSTGTKIEGSEADFTWESLNAADWYIHQIARDPDFKDIIRRDSINEAENFVRDLPKGSRLYWRVASCNDSTLMWSETWSFDTDLINYSPKPESPFCGSLIQRTSVLIEWEKVIGATRYDFELSEDPSFQIVKRHHYQLEDTSVRIINLDPDINYYWRFRAYNDTEMSNWSEPCDFSLQFLSKVFDKAKNLELKIYKSEDELTIESQSADLQLLRIELLDIQGKNMGYNIIPESFRTAVINISSLPTGLYFIKIESSSGLAVEKLLKW